MIFGGFVVILERDAAALVKRQSARTTLHILLEEVVFKLDLI